MSLTKATFSMILGAPANVLDYGAKGDGITDDTAAIQAAVNASRNVYFPQPSGAFYKCTSPITLMQDSVVEGANKQNTVVKFFGCAGFIASTAGAGTYDIQIRNISVIGDGTGVTSDGIRIDGTAGNFGLVDIENVIVGYFAQSGVVFIKPIVSQLRLVSSSFNGNYGFFIEGSGTSVYASSCYANTNGSDGWYIYNDIEYSAFDACASDSNTGNGWNFNGSISTPAQAITLTSCGAEINGGNQFLFTATLGLTLNGIFTNPGSPASGGNFIELNGARYVSINGVRMQQTAPTGKYALFVDNIGGTQNPTAISLNGCLFSSTNATTDELISVTDQPRFSSGTGTYSNTNTITHNLGITPTNVFVSTGSATVIASAYNFTSTTFQVTIYNLAVSPPTPVSGQSINWQASWQA
jgi:hypothetical protein